jgi:hypothetical protein
MSRSGSVLERETVLWLTLFMGLALVGGGIWLIYFDPTGRTAINLFGNSPLLEMIWPWQVGRFYEISAAALLKVGGEPVSKSWVGGSVFGLTISTLALAQGLDGPVSRSATVRSEIDRGQELAFNCGLGNGIKFRSSWRV